MSEDLPETMRARWRKVADLMRVSVHVFRNASGKFMACTNAAQGDGELVEVLRPVTAVERAEPDGTHGLGAIAGRTGHEEPGT